MRHQKIKSYNGFELGDFVMISNKPSYYVVTGMRANITEEGDYWVKYRGRKIGEIVSVDVSLQKILNQNGSGAEKQEQLLR